MVKKVLIIASVISFIEWFNKDNVDFLQKRLKCDVHIACNFDYVDDTDENRTLEYINELQADGVELHNIHFDRNPLGISNIKAFKQLKLLIKNEHFDLIHTHTPVASILSRLITKKARKEGTVIMYTCHGFHFHRTSSIINWLIYFPVEKWMSRYTDYLITINMEDYKRARSFHASHVRYIPGVGVDINKIKNTRIDKKKYKKSLGIPENCMMLLSIGEMIERKNHKVIIRALGKLKRDDIYYVICGKGPLKEYLANLANDEKVHIVFLGFREDIPELCNAADVAAFPSKIEGLGLAGIEALAAGVPLVSSNVHGILDYMIDGKTGFLCDPDDVDGFAKAIDKLAGDESLRRYMKDFCVKIVEPFDKSNALNEMWNIYKEILE